MEDDTQEFTVHRGVITEWIDSLGQGAITHAENDDATFISEQWFAPHYLQPEQFLEVEAIYAHDELLFVRPLFSRRRNRYG